MNEQARIEEAERVAYELEQTADHGSSPEGEPAWRKVYEHDLRQQARRLRGEQ